MEILEVEAPRLSRLDAGLDVPATVLAESSRMSDRAAQKKNRGSSNLPEPLYIVW